MCTHKLSINIFLYLSLFAFDDVICTPETALGIRTPTPPRLHPKKRKTKNEKTKKENKMTHDICCLSRVQKNGKRLSVGSGKEKKRKKKRGLALAAK